MSSLATSGRTSIRPLTARTLFLVGVASGRASDPSVAARDNPGKLAALARGGNAGTERAEPANDQDARRQHRPTVPPREPECGAGRDERVRRQRGRNCAMPSPMRGVRVVPALLEGAGWWVLLPIRRVQAIQLGESSSVAQTVFPAVCALQPQRRDNAATIRRPRTRSAAN